MIVFVVFLTLCIVSVGGNQLLLVSMDGFRWDYLKQFHTPNFDRLARGGTKAEYLNNVFPTETHPNHYSISTGLYAESHGIIGNDMYDPIFKQAFDFYTTESKWWDEAEPIWVTLRRQGRTCGSVSWPGAEVSIHGYTPNIFIPYNETMPAKYRIDKAMHWLTVWQFDFVALYFPEPDSVGHSFGPGSPEVQASVESMDQSLGYLMQQFDSLHLWDKVNLIVLSDHGMVSVDMRNSAVAISDYVNMDLIERTVGEGAYMHIKPITGRVDDVVNSLRQAPHIQVFRKEDIPERWHFKNNRRVFPVFLLADEGWSIGLNKSEVVEIGDTVKGNHGYDNTLSSMKPIFLANGPNITVNHQTPVFNSVDVYPLLCRLLDMQPVPNNGSEDATSGFVTANKPNGVGNIVGK